MKNQKICMIATRHEPGDPRIFEKEARSLARRGIQVEIVVPEGKRPKDVQGIEFKFYRKSAGGLRKLSTIYHVFKLCKKSEAKIFHCHEADVSLFIGFLMKLTRKDVILIFDCHEFFMAYFAEQFPKFFRPFFKILFLIYEKIVVGRCDHVITANSIEKSYYHILFPRKKVTEILNVPILKSTGSYEELQREEIYDICCEGILSLERGLDILFELIRNLKQNFEDIQFLLVGKIWSKDGQSETWAEKFIKENNLGQNITVTGWVSYEEIYPYHLKSKIGIFLYKFDTANNILAGPPNKLFNFMQAGLPVIGSDLPETKRIIDEVGCGYTVDPEDLRDIEKKVKYLLQNEKARMQMGRAGFRAVIDRYNWGVEEQKLYRVYEHISRNE